MNVKQGDLAVQIGSLAENHGKICRVIQFEGDIWHEGVLQRDVWLVEYPSPVKTTLGHVDTQAYCCDAWLRPVSGIPDEQTEEESNKLEV